MNILKKLFGVKDKDNAIKRYFKTGLFNKFIATLVTACFVISIVNLPAFASLNEKEKGKDIIKSASEHEDVLYQNGGYLSVNEMLSQDVTEKDGALMVKGEAKGSVVDGKAIVTGPDGKELKQLSQHYTNLMESKVGAEATRLGLCSYDENSNKFIKNDLSDTAFKDKIGEISNKTKLSSDAVEAILNRFETAKDKKEESKVVQKPEENSNVLNAQTNINQTSPVKAATDALSAASEDIIQKGIMAPVGPISQVATSIFNPDDNANNNNGQTELRATEQELKDAVTNISDAANNKEEFNEAVNNVTEQKETTQQQAVIQPEQQQQAIVSPTSTNSNPVVNNNEQKNTGIAKLTGVETVNEKDKTNKTDKKAKVTKEQAIKNSADKVKKNIEKASKKAKDVIKDVSVNTTITKDKKNKNKTTKKTVESYTRNGAKITITTTKTVTKQKDGSLKIEYNRVKESKGKDGKITKTEVNRNFTAKKKGKGTWEITGGTENVTLSKDGKKVKTIKKTINGTRKEIRDKNGNKRIIYDLRIKTNTINGKKVNLKEEHRVATSTYRKINGKVYRTYSKVSTIDGKTTKVNTSSVVDKNGKQTLCKLGQR